MDPWEPAAVEFGSEPRESTFTIFADRYGPAAELAGLRQSFTAASICHAVSVDRRHGIVTLTPGDITLKVGSEADDYARIRVVDQSMGLVGTMSCSSDGTVRWRAADDFASRLTESPLAFLAVG